MEEKLKEIRGWAKDKIASGAEPPWSWYQYMKLIETVDAILSGQAAITKESSQQSVRHQGAHLRLVDSKGRPDNVQPHQDGMPVQMPM